MQILWARPESKWASWMRSLKGRSTVIVLALAVLLYAAHTSYEASSSFMIGSWFSSFSSSGSNNYYNIYNQNKTGNVGIGTDFTPTTNWPNSLLPSPLTVVSSDTKNNSTKAIATFYENDQKLGVGIASNHIFETGTNSNNSLYIDAQGTGNLLLQSAATGEVQIGTTNGNRELEVYGMVYSHDLNNNSGYISDSTNGYGGNFAGTTAGVYSQNVSTQTLLNYLFTYNNANYNYGVYSTGDICMNIGGGDHSSDICLSQLNAAVNELSKCGTGKNVYLNGDGSGRLTINSGYTNSTYCQSCYFASNAWRKEYKGYQSCNHAAVDTAPAQGANADSSCQVYTKAGYADCNNSSPQTCPNQFEGQLGTP